MFGYKGIQYSSPTLSSIISNLTPAFTFILAIIARMEKLEIRSWRSRAKIIGTILSIAGALVVVLYKGPRVISSLSSSSTLLHQPLVSKQSDWVVGGLLLSADFILVCVFYIVQAQTVSKYPAEILVVSLYDLSAAIIATPVTLLLEKDFSAWRINSRIMLIAILYGGFCGFSFAVVILTWGLRMKGPVYVAIFHPCTIAIAAFSSVLFLGESLYLGSILGAIIVSVGFYMVIWGKANESNTEEYEIPNQINCALSITTKILLLGIVGFASTMLGHVGINYSSPALSSTMSNLVPAFTFILTLIFRMERFALNSSSSQAKLLGTIVSIAGAFIVNLYRGSRIFFTPSTPSVSLGHLPLGSSSQSYWAIGGLLFTVEYRLLPAQVVKEYPAELTIVFFYCLIVSILDAIVGVFTVTDSSAWRIRPNIALISILCSGIIGSFVNNAVHTWALCVKGPLYVALFKPLSIAIAVAMGVLFLGDTIYLGSVIGATIISTGFYTVMWGKAKEGMGENNEVSNSVESEASSSTPKAPLLQSYTNQDMEASGNYL